MFEANTQRREFTMDRALLGTVIHAQAGTLGKGVLEAVMNSIDAEASTVHITTSNTTLLIVDDGKGIKTEQELEQHFDRFGTPHVEGDARFGKFRIVMRHCISFTTLQVLADVAHAFFLPVRVTLESQHRA